MAPPGKNLFDAHERNSRKEMRIEAKTRGNSKSGPDQKSDGHAAGLNQVRCVWTIAQNTTVELKDNLHATQSY